MQKHFVTFYSPGTFVHEETTQLIETWDVAEACRRAATVLERYHATPFGFQFSTRARTEEQLDSEVIARSPLYYLGGTVFTLAEIEARNDPRDKILRQNMKANKWEKVIENTNSRKVVQPLYEGDIVLD